MLNGRTTFLIAFLLALYIIPLIVFIYYRRRPQPVPPQEDIPLEERIVVWTPQSSLPQPPPQAYLGSRWSD